MRVKIIPCNWQDEGTWWFRPSSLDLREIASDERQLPHAQMSLCLAANSYLAECWGQLCGKIFFVAVSKHQKEEWPKLMSNQLSYTAVSDHHLAELKWALDFSFPLAERFI